MSELNQSMARSSIMLLLINGILISLGGCGSSRKYFGTSDEVWSNTINGLKTKYRQDQLFPGTSGGVSGLIPMSAADRVDRSGGRATLVMPGGLLSISAAEICMSPTNAITPQWHTISVRVWRRDWPFGFGPTSNTAMEREILDALAPSIAPK